MPSAVAAEVTTLQVHRHEFGRHLGAVEDLKDLVVHTIRIQTGMAASNSFDGHLAHVV